MVEIKDTSMLVQELEFGQEGVREAKNARKNDMQYIQLEELTSLRLKETYPNNSNGGI